MIRQISRRALITDIVVASAVCVLFTPLAFAVVDWWSMYRAPAVMAVIAVIFSALLQCAGMAIGRLAPGLALALAWAGAVVQMLGGLPPLPVNVAILVVLFATAAWGSQRVFWLGLISAGAGALVASIYLFAADSVGGLGATITIVTLMTVIAALVLCTVWLAGMVWRFVLRARENREGQIRAERQTAEEQERVRIARDMHDVVAHSLAVVIAQADGARYAAASDPAAATEALSTISQTSRAALSDVRMLLTQLRHRQGDGPQPTLADLEALFAQVRQAGVEPRVTVDPAPPGEPPAAVQLAVYRILQEALTNAIRHGEGVVDVHLAWWPEHVDLDVRNPFDPRAAAGVGGHGIIGMRERAQLAGGTLHTESEGGSFIVRARLPIGVHTVGAQSGTGVGG